MRTFLSAWVALLTAGCFAPYGSDRAESDDSRTPGGRFPLATALRSNSELCIVVAIPEDRFPFRKIIRMVHRPDGWSEPEGLTSGELEANQLACALDEREQLHVIVGGTDPRYFVFDGDGRTRVENIMQMSKSATVHMAGNRFGDIIAVIGDPDRVRILRRQPGGDWVLRSLPKPHRYPRIMDIGYADPPVVLFGSRVPARLGELVEPIRAPRATWYAVRGDTLFGNHGDLWYAWRPDSARRFIARDSEATSVIERAGHLLLSAPRGVRYSGPQGERTFDGCRPEAAALHVDAAGRPQLLFVLENRIEVYTLRDGVWKGDAVTFAGKPVKALWRERGQARAAADP